VHLGFNKGLLDTELSDVFMNAGAKCVSGYSAATNAIYDGKVLAEMAKVMLVNDDKHTVTDANAAIDAASLGSNTFYHHFTTLTGTKFKYNIMQVTTRFVLDANHPSSNDQLKWWKDEETPAPSEKPDVPFPYAMPEILNVNIVKTPTNIAGEGKAVVITVTFDVRNNFPFTWYCGIEHVYLYADDVRYDGAGRLTSVLPYGKYSLEPGETVSRMIDTGWVYNTNPLAAGTLEPRFYDIDFTYDGFHYIYNYEKNELFRATSEFGHHELVQ
jgi:hypothetical protein